VFEETIGVANTGKKLEPANPMSRAVHEALWQAVMKLPDVN
jgi:hypothetical protein